MPRWVISSVAPVDPSRSRATGDNDAHHVNDDNHDVDSDEDVDGDSDGKDDNDDNDIEDDQNETWLASLDTGPIGNNDNNENTYNNHDHDVGLTTLGPQTLAQGGTAIYSGKKKLSRYM